MKILTRIIIVLIALNLMTGDFALAQTTPTTVEQTPEVSTTNIPQGQEKSEVDRLMRSISLSTGRRSFGTGTGGTILVIPTQEIKTEELLTINEDMNVMLRILDDRLDQERLTKSSMSWSFTGNRWISDDFTTFFGRDGSRTGGMYLQGYGALFLMNVDFPLSAPPDIEEQEEEETVKEDVDPVWEQTRQQMYEPQETSRRRPGRGDRMEVKYDAEKVENLKTTLIKAFKHAANIRILKPDESVILSITGKDVSDGIVGMMQKIPGTGDTLVVEEVEGRQVTRVYKGGVPDDIKFSSPTALIIRAKKSDIDDFAQGDLDIDKFREKVQILGYPLLSGNVSGTSSALTLPTIRGTGRR